MNSDKMDIAKVLAILAQPKEPPSPLTDVERLKLDVPFLDKNGEKQVRPVRAVLPAGVPRPMPLIYVPHYEIGEDSAELRDYLAQGWAVACPDAFDNRHNGALTDDDLVFNNAALFALRHRPEFDRNRIALVGGSAGGYMTLMLSGLQAGLCVSVANGPIANVYFNFRHYFGKANELNHSALARLMAENGGQKPGGENPMELMRSVAKLPIPFLAALTGVFAPVQENFPDASDASRWAALSPIGVADGFCSPVMVNHCTSDVLVPVDQITRRFTYPQPGDSLPADFDLRLPEDFPGILSRTLEECLPEAETQTVCIPVPEQAGESVLPYDREKRFQLNIFDDGPPEGYGTHSSRMDVGRRHDVPYLREMLTKTAAETCILTPAMLHRMLERYQGKDIALPAHSGIDDTVYGSLTVYRQEVRETLTDWVGNHSLSELEEIARKLPQEVCRCLPEILD